MCCCLLPAAAADGASLETEAGVLEVSVPTARGEALESSSTERVFETTSADALVAVQSTAEGLRSMIHINSAAAPERYEFKISGDVTSLRLAPDGGAVALGTDGAIIGIAPVPWAVDANGVAVPTHFEVEGTTLIQIVEHHAGTFAYGVVADPLWNPFSWPWGKWVSKSEKTIVSVLKKCGEGALLTTLGLGIGTGTTNILIEKFGSSVAKVKVGGAYGYVGAAAAGCIINNL